MNKVLIIGTDRSMIDRLQGMLPKSDNHKISIAHSGFEAGIQAESFHPDSIILDLAMGRSEGLQIVANLRRNTAYDNCVIIGIAAEDETETDSLIAGGFSEIFKKPFDPALLAERIKSLVRNRRERY